MKKTEPVMQIFGLRNNRENPEITKVYKERFEEEMKHLEIAKPNMISDIKGWED